MDYTKNAVERQLNAMGCNTYEIGIYHAQKGMINKNYTKDEILNSINYLKFQNLNGNNIYIRPAECDNTPIILVDDIDEDNIKKLNDIGINVAIIIETSKNNYQVWIKLHESIAPEIKSQIAKNITKFAHGDPASAEKRHYGRLAGFTNRKEKYNIAGKFPYVLCRYSGGDIAKKSKELIEKAENYIEQSNKSIEENKIEIRRNTANIETTNSLFIKYFEEWTRKQCGEIDASKGDFAAAARLLQEGHAPEAVEAAISHESPEIETRKGKNVSSYAARTVQAARKRLK